MEEEPRQKEKRSRIIWKQNIILGIVFSFMGVAGFLYGWEKGFALGGITWAGAFALISLYSFLVLKREGY
ncbi:MAG: hypothetical protein JSW01_03340 [Candidatus Bathyarchaeota archaeon]|nr:MAG: hypothetical protein JSW01_03340 [Candidatus Bathyarchaeota archaeon]